MAVLDAVRELLPSEQLKPDKGIKQRIDRGRARMRDGAAKRNECLRFWRGDQYCYVSSDGYLVKQQTVSEPDGSGKPRWRVRQVHANLILDHVEQALSAANQRVPGFEVEPSTIDPEDVSAARLSEKVARFGYDKWSWKRMIREVATYALVADEGFAWPYFDNTVGPYIPDPAGGPPVGQGEVCIHTYGPNEVFWEPGQQFQDSRWHAVEQAMALEDVYEMDGYLGGKLKPDASGSDTLGEKAKHAKNLVLVTNYLERPSPSRPQGRWQVIANERQIIAERNYPCEDGKGQILDEPVLHRLSYIPDPDSDRDMGLVRHLLDGQRSFNDVNNKLMEWKNLAAVGQWVALPGAVRTDFTDEPGAVFEVTDLNAVKPRDIPPIHPELFSLPEMIRANLGRVAGHNDIPPQVSASQAINQIISQDQSRWADFISFLAQFHARLMRHCLYLVQRYYNEPRLLQIRGRFGPELIQDFMGAQLNDQTMITVNPGSIAPRTRDAVQQQVLAFADRGWISAQAAMAAINGGNAEALVESYELDVSRANLVIQKLKAGPDVYLAEPFTATAPVPGAQVPMPSWAPRKFDNVEVHKAIFADWMKTQDYDAQPPPVQEAANLYYDACEYVEQQKQAAADAAQAAQAAEQGAMNATRPAQPKPMPSMAQPQGDLSPAH